MKKIHLTLPLTLGSILAAFPAYYLLLCENILHISISSIMSYAHHLHLRHHVLVMGLLPIYIGLVIFGTMWIGIYLSNRLQYVITFLWRKVALKT